MNIGDIDRRESIYALACFAKYYMHYVFFADALTSLIGRLRMATSYRLIYAMVYGTAVILLDMEKD